MNEKAITNLAHLQNNQEKLRKIDKMHAFKRNIFFNENCRVLLKNLAL